MPEDGGKPPQQEDQQGIAGRQRPASSLLNELIDAYFPHLGIHLTILLVPFEPEVVIAPPDSRQFRRPLDVAARGVSGEELLLMEAEFSYMQIEEPYEVRFLCLLPFAAIRGPRSADPSPAALQAVAALVCHSQRC